jgi:hypothetical protein
MKAFGEPAGITTENYEVAALLVWREAPIPEAAYGSSTLIRFLLRAASNDAAVSEVAFVWSGDRALAIDIERIEDGGKP